MADLLFELALKSTMDYLCGQVADMIRKSGDPDLTNLLADGLDNLVTIDANSKNKNPAILWQMGHLKPAPLAPLFEVSFSVGVKTTSDDANYVMSKVLSMLANHFKVSMDFQVYDYSVRAEDLQGQPPLGVLLITDTNSSPMLFDNQSGLKLLDLDCKVMQFV